MSGLPHYLAQRIELSGSCWLWTGPRQAGGYGHVHVPGSGKGASPRLVHRLAYELLVGSIPEGLTLDHLCRTRACLNPAHLEPCTRGENVLRGNTITAANAAKTHCKHGHEFNPENTRWCSDGSRECKTCRRATDERYRIRHGLRAAA